MPIGHINHCYRIDDRDDEFSRSSNGIIESGRSMTLHCTENPQLVSRFGSEPAPFTQQSVPLKMYRLGGETDSAIR